MSRILVTGGAGFIGYNICRILSDDPDNSVVVADDFSRGARDEEFRELIERENVDLIDIDLCNRGEFEKLDDDYDMIYNLAAVVGVRNVTENPVKTVRTNSLSVINLLDHIADMNKKPKLLFTSSCENYAGSIKSCDVPIPTPEKVPLCIEDVFNPRWTYASSKILGEIACIHYSREYGFPVGIVRYHNVYGPRMGNEHVIPEFILRFREQKDEYPLYGGYQSRSFCYVEDAARMTINVMNNPQVRCDVVNVGNDRDVLVIKDLALMIMNILGNDGSLVEEGAPDGSVSKRVPDLKRIRELGSYVYNVSMEEGLQKTVEYYLNQ
ncbi:MAG: NAD-dependent epimerase/dehydratase family protein [Thermoplasmatota archaeon]